MMAAGNDEVFLESSDSTPQTYVHDLVQVFDDDSDTENDLSLEEGENWLRLVDRSNTTGNLALDNTQDMTPERARLPYPVLLQLGSIDAPTDDCYICFDVDGPVVAIKDMRNPFSSNDEDDEHDETLKIYIARRKAIKEEEEASPSAGVDNNTGTDKDVDDAKTEQDASSSPNRKPTGQQPQRNQMWQDYGRFEVLPRRQLRILRHGDRICTRFTAGSTSSKGGVGGFKDRDVGLVLEYRYSDSPTRLTTQNGFGAGVAIAAEASDDEKEEGEYVLTQPISEDDGEADDRSQTMETECVDPQVLPGQESEASDHDEEASNEKGNREMATETSSSKGLRNDVDDTTKSGDTAVPEKHLGSQFEVLRKIAEALPYVAAEPVGKEKAAETNIEKDASPPTKVAMRTSDLRVLPIDSREGSDETAKLVPVLTTQPIINNKKKDEDSDDETTMDQSESENVAEVVTSQQKSKSESSNAADLDDRTETLPDSEPCSLDAPTQQIFGTSILPPPEPKQHVDSDEKKTLDTNNFKESIQSKIPLVQNVSVSTEHLKVPTEIAQISVPECNTAHCIDMPTQSCQEGANALYSLLQHNGKPHGDVPSIRIISKDDAVAHLPETSENTSTVLIQTSATSATATAVHAESVSLVEPQLISTNVERLKQPNNETRNDADGDESRPTVAIEVPASLGDVIDSQITAAMEGSTETNQETTTNRLPPIPEVSVGNLEVKAVISGEKESASHGSACLDATETTNQQSDVDSSEMDFNPVIDAAKKKGRYGKSFASTRTKGRTRRSAKSSDLPNETGKQQEKVDVAPARPKEPPIDTTTVAPPSGALAPPGATSQDDTKVESVASPMSHESSLKSRASKRSLQSSAGRPASKRARALSPANPATQTKSTLGLDTADIRVVATNVHLTPSQKKMIERIGGVLLDDVQDAINATHVIAAEGKSETNEDDEPSFKRTSKLMIGICCTENVVHLDWLIKSAKKKNVLAAHDFLLLKDRAAEKRYNFNMRESLRRRKEMRMSEQTLLGGWGVYVCQGVANNKAPPENELKLIVEAAGGTWLSSPRDRKALNTLIITSDPETKKQTSSKGVSTAIKQGAKKYPVSWLFDCIMAQQLNIN